MIKRIAAALLALCLVLPLAACGQGGELELNIDELGEELYSVGTFGEELYALDESVAQGLYGTDADTRCWVRAGTGATAEELALFRHARRKAEEAGALGLPTLPHCQAQGHGAKPAGAGFPRT